MCCSVLKNTTQKGLFLHSTCRVYNAIESDTQTHRHTDTQTWGGSNLRAPWIIMSWLQWSTVQRGFDFKDRLKIRRRKGTKHSRTCHYESRFFCCSCRIPFLGVSILIIQSSATTQRAKERQHAQSSKIPRKRESEQERERVRTSKRKGDARAYEPGGKRHRADLNDAVITGGAYKT